MQQDRGDDEMEFSKYPNLRVHERAVAWLTFECNRGLAENTLHAYARGLEDFFTFCQIRGLEIMRVGRDHIGEYINALRQRPLPAHARPSAFKQAAGLTNNTINQRLTAVRRFYDYLQEDGLVENNPVRRGRYRPHHPQGGERGLIPTLRNFPWLPDLQQWQDIIAVLQKQNLREKLLFALSYDGALRREEVCGLHIRDFDVAYRLVTIRAENTKNRRARTVPYTEGTGRLLQAYLHQRVRLSRQPGALFLSESPRNYAQPMSSAIWSKTMRRIAGQANVPQFTPHTLRHLRLTDLARAGIDLHDLAAFAGHRSIDTTIQYIHLSGADLAERLAAHFPPATDNRLQGLSDETAATD
jgi:integrase/recombinase XerD